MHVDSFAKAILCIPNGMDSRDLPIHILQDSFIGTVVIVRLPDAAEATLKDIKYSAVPS